MRRQANEAHSLLRFHIEFDGFLANVLRSKEPASGQSVRLLSGLACFAAISGPIGTRAGPEQQEMRYPADDRSNHRRLQTAAGQQFGAEQAHNLTTNPLTVNWPISDMRAAHLKMNTFITNTNRYV